MIQTFDGIKQQLWDYYKKQNEYAMSLAEEVLVMDVFTGERGKVLLAPIGLRSELEFIRDEIKVWMRLEKEAKKGL